MTKEEERFVRNQVLTEDRSTRPDDKISPRTQPTRVSGSLPLTFRAPRDRTCMKLREPDDRLDPAYEDGVENECGEQHEVDQRVEADHDVRPLESGARDVPDLDGVEVEGAPEHDGFVVTCEVQEDPDEEQVQDSVFFTSRAPDQS